MLSISHHGYIAYTCSCGLLTTCIAMKEGHFCNILIMLFLILNVLSFIQSDQIKENNLNRILNLSLICSNKVTFVTGSAIGHSQWCWELQADQDRFGRITQSRGEVGTVGV